MVLMALVLPSLGDSSLTRTARMVLAPSLCWDQQWQCQRNQPWYSDRLWVQPGIKWTDSGHISARRKHPSSPSGWSQLRQTKHSSGSPTNPLWFPSKWTPTPSLSKPQPFRRFFLAAWEEDKLVMPAVSYIQRHGRKLAYEKEGISTSTLEDGNTHPRIYRY